MATLFKHRKGAEVMDAEGNIFIKGRCKNMVLGPNGQNIYPEELEAKWNNMPFVCESLIVMHEHKLVALVYPDMGEAARNGLNEKQLMERLETNRMEINKELAAYEQITRVVLRNEEFEKTAKKSIKRYYKPIFGHCGRFQRNNSNMEKPGTRG